MKKLFAILICTALCATLLVACEMLCIHRWDEGVEIEGGGGAYVMEYTCLSCGEKHRETIMADPPQELAPDTAGAQFTAYKNQVTKDEFQKQYAQAFNNRQPDYKRDFVYVYTNDFTEVYEGGEDISSTVERIEYDADSEMILRRYEFKNNDQPTPAYENYFWEYTQDGELIRFYDSRTDETVILDYGFDEFWEFAENQVPLVLFPNPNKLYNDSTYYIDKDGDGNTVFTLYSSDENGYSLRQVVFSDAEMIYRTKSYTKEESYEDTIIDIYRVYNEALSLTTHS